MTERKELFTGRKQSHIGRLLPEDTEIPSVNESGTDNATSGSIFKKNNERDDDKRGPLEEGEVDECMEEGEVYDGEGKYAFRRQWKKHYSSHGIYNAYMNINKRSNLPKQSKEEEAARLKEQELSRLRQRVIRSIENNRRRNNPNKINKP